MPVAEHLDTIDKIARLVENHGAMLVFSCVSGLLNTFFIVQLLRGKLVPDRMYTRAIEEADRLQEVMEKERVMSMHKLLTFMGNLKTFEPSKDNNKEDI